MQVALGVPVLLASGVDRSGLAAIRELAVGNKTLAFLGASGVGKSTLVNALLGDEVMDTGEVREADHRGRHTTIAAQMLKLPGEGWLIDTPGVRAVSLWLSGHGIERAFADVFDLMDRCRFRDCKHDREPGARCGPRSRRASSTRHGGPVSSDSSPRSRHSRKSSAAGPSSTIGGRGRGRL